MEQDPPPVRCPCCGSHYTSPLEGSVMWECHYSLCRAVFPVLPAYRYRERGQMALVAEEEPPYLPVTRHVPDEP